uniref:SWI/SNF complex subunit SWI3D n=1 Tax=Anthurium amnicola TaxID=1678845 RepID=A0A1D1Z7J1_9ARAE
MEEKGREATPATHAEQAPPETLTEGSRRRASAPKRKGPAAQSSSSSSTTSKRVAKERNHLHFVPHVHNGPVTRARQSPNKFAAAAAAAALPQNLAEQPPASDAAGAAGPRESQGAGEQLVGVDGVPDPVDEPVVDAEFEAVRSRGSNVHVVPTHAGWFSWEKIHALEERTMTSFFNGRSEKRTSDFYVKIRNSIMEKFHNDPQTEVELKHLSEFEIGDLDARQEVMEFLDHWGLINFHPFPPSTSDTSTSNAEGIAKTPSLSERLYLFETVQPAQHLAPKRVELSAPAMPPRLFPESAMADDLVRPEGPSVEYHCNSCSADCSRKRYHCQKQADFDLCTDCYNDGKFGSGMTPADFILMEPAEVPGTGGGSWTDQETLLLLEALELYKENWNEIAEHVATKTKAQCMLHFVQMPIEDVFLEDNDDRDDRKNDHVLTSKDLSASGASEKIEGKTVENEDNHVTCPAGISKGKDDCKTEPVQGISSSSVATNALKTAFQTVGSLPEAGGILSFAEAGNPVMALASFLVTLVDRDLALTSSRSSLKAMSEDSSGVQLATRHCFTLEDPPEHRKDQHAFESEVAQREEAQVPVINGNEEPQCSIEKDDKTAAPKNNAPSVSPGECAQNHIANKSTDLDASVKEGVPVEESGILSLRGGKNVRRSIKGPRELSLPNEKAAGCNDNSSVALDPNQEGNPKTTKESRELHADEATPSTSKETKAKEFPSPKENDSTLPGEQLPGAVKDSVDVMALVEGSKQSSETSRPVNMSSTEEKGHQNAVDSCSAVVTGEPAVDDVSKSVLSNGEMNCESVKTEDDDDINKIRRAAVTALSAASVNARLLANLEVDQIRQLVSFVIEKQLQKLEIKLALFSDIERVISCVREQLEKARQRLIHERAQIIAARYGLPASSSRSIAPSLPSTKFAMSHSFSGSRPSSLATQKSPIKRQ